MESERINKALDIVLRFGGIDGSHHKMWVIDQVVRALSGCPMIDCTSTSKDYRGDEHTYTYQIQGESEEYKEWVRNAKDGEDGPNTYEWDEGIAP